VIERAPRRDAAGYQRRPRNFPLDEWLIQKAVPDGMCLRWPGDLNSNGYGLIRVDGVKRGVHRVAYEVLVGPIPDGYEIDHVWSRGCRFRDCIEPSHLEAVTREENVRRMTQKRTHCGRGHEFSEANTAWRVVKGVRTNSRICRTCRQHNREQRWARLSQIPPGERVVYRTRRQDELDGLREPTTQCPRCKTSLRAPGRPYCAPCHVKANAAAIAKRKARQAEAEEQR